MKILEFLTDWITYWYFLYKELSTWSAIKKIAKTNQFILEKAGFRVDKLGRIYTVVNIPQELMDNPFSYQYGKELYLTEKVQEYNEIFIKLGILSDLYPEITEIKGSSSYLLVLWPPTDYFNWISIFKNISFISILITLLLIFL